MSIDLERLGQLYNEHVYMSGYVLQRYHSGPNGKKLTGKKRPDWTRCYAELKGCIIYRWDAGNYYGKDQETIKLIKSGNLMYVKSKNISKHDPIDVIFTEFNWVGQHSKYSEIQNLVVMDGIERSDRTYWNFGNSTTWENWHAAIEMSRHHRRLILQRHLHEIIKCIPDSIAPVDSFPCEVKWLGSTIAKCQLRFREGVEIRKESRGSFIKLKRIKEIYVFEGRLEIFGKFKSSKLEPDICHYLTLKIDKDQIDQALQKFMALDCLEVHFRLIKDFKEPVKRVPKCQSEVYQAQSQTIDSDETQASTESISGKDSLDSKIVKLEGMFITMLPMIVEEAPFETLPVEFFYKSLLLAWEAAGLRLVPTPQMIAQWMTGLSYRVVKIDGRDSWIGIKLRPINYELYRKKKEQKSQQVEELI